MEQIKTKDLPEILTFDGNTYVLVDDGTTRKINALNLLDYNFLQNKPSINGEVLRDNITLNTKLYRHYLEIWDGVSNRYYFTILSPKSTQLTADELVTMQCALANPMLFIEDSFAETYNYYVLLQARKSNNRNQFRLDYVTNIANGETTFTIKDFNVIDIRDTVTELI